MIFVACGSLHSCVMEYSPEELEQGEIERAIEEGYDVKIRLWQRREDIPNSSRYDEEKQRLTPQLPSKKNNTP